MFCARQGIARCFSSYNAALLALTFAVATAAHAQSQDEQALPTDKQVAILQSMTPQEVARGVTVRDDDLETAATLTSEAAYQTNGRFNDRVRSDNFLRAFIDKKTGEARFQVYQEITYGVAYRNFQTVSYSTTDGPSNSDLEVISHDMPCNYGVCFYKDIVGFTVDEQVLRAVAAGYKAGNSPYWRFRFHAQNGLDWNDRMMPAEVAGMLAAVDTYRQAHPHTR